MLDILTAISRIVDHKQTSVAAQASCAFLSFECVVECFRVGNPRDSVPKRTAAVSGRGTDFKLVLDFLVSAD